MMTRLAGRASLAAAAAAALVGWAGFALEAPPPAAPLPPTDPLVAMNLEFRAAYANARSRALAATSPVLLAESDRLLLLRDGKREEASTRSDLYDSLKAIAHIPLAVDVVLGSVVPFEEMELTPERERELTSFRQRVNEIGPVLDRQGFTPEQKKRQEEIRDRSLAFIDRTLAARTIRREDLIAFARGMAPLALANADEAAAAKLDIIHAAVAAWKSELPVDEWRRLRVVVVGPHNPRVDNLTMQYFQKTLEGPLDDRRLVYAEALFEEAKALTLLGTIVLDAAVGEHFFDDPLRMHRDLLGDAAKKYLSSTNLEH
ncbi:MAG: hypothetical protein ACRC1K_14875 [Planctomycetia bacterium]